ncbi:MAG: hypothetical protein QXD77_01130 [Candidatus Aenigmatarchaeota archaeon]
MKKGAEALKERLLIAYLRKDAMLESGIYEGAKFGRRHAENPFALFEDGRSAAVAKKLGGEIGRRQGEKMADYGKNIVMPPQERAKELQKEALSDFANVPTDFGIGYALAAGEQLCKNSARLGAELFNLAFGWSGFRLPAASPQAYEFLDSLDDADVKGVLNAYETGKGAIDRDVPGAAEFVKFLREKRK